MVTQNASPNLAKISQKSTIIVHKTHEYISKFVSRKKTTALNPVRPVEWRAEAFPALFFKLVGAPFANKRSSRDVPPGHGFSPVYSARILFFYDRKTARLGIFQELSYSALEKSTPSALCLYVLPRLRVVSSVQQLSVPLQHVCCSSCNLSDHVASHSSELLSAFFLSFVFFGIMPGIFFLVFVVFRPCSSYLFLFSTYVVPLAAFLIFLHHTVQNSCRLFCPLLMYIYNIIYCHESWYFAFVWNVLESSHDSRGVLFLIFVVWLVLSCCRTRYASISLALPWLIAVVLVLLCLNLWPHNLYLFRMKNQHGHWVYWCRWVERAV